MHPIEFKEATVELKKPADMTDEECSSLWIYRHEGEHTCISLWTAPFWQRVKFLFHGRVWLGVRSGTTQPPVWLDMKKNIFKKEESAAD